MIFKQLLAIPIIEDRLDFAYLAAILYGHLFAVTPFNHAMKMPHEDPFRESLILKRRAELGNKCLFILPNSLGDRVKLVQFVFIFKCNSKKQTSNVRVSFSRIAA